MASQHHNSNNGTTRSQGTIVEDLGEDSPSDQTIRKSAPVSTEDVHLTLNGQRQNASPEGKLSHYKDDTSHQQMPSALQDVITSVAMGKELATQGQHLVPRDSDSKALVQTLSNVSNSVVADKMIFNVYKTTENPVSAEGIREPSELTALRAKTQRKLKKLKETALFETQAVRAAKEKLRTGLVVVDGPCKSGKTCLGFHLLKTFDKDFIPLYITENSELKTVLDFNIDPARETEKTSKQKVFVIFIDEILKPNMHESLHEILDQVEDGTCHLILTTSSEIRKEKPHKEFDFILKKPDKTIYLMKYPLHENERFEIFKCSERRLHWLKQKVEGMKEFLVLQIAKVTDYPWYLQLLHEIESTERGSVDVLDFFAQPTSFLEGVFMNMYTHNIEKFMTLVIILNKGYLKDSKKCYPESPHGIFEALKDVYGNEMLSMKRIRDAAEDMIGEFLLFSDNQFVFIHDSITVPLCRVFFQRDSDLGIKWCPLSFLISMTKTKNCLADDPSKIIISDDEEDLLIERFYQEKPSSLLEILKHPGFSDQHFLERFIKHVPLLKDHYSDILMQAITHRQLPLLKEILRYLRTMDGKGCHIKLPALEMSCEVGNDEAFFELINSGVEPNDACVKACQHGKNEKILSYLLHHFGRHSSLVSPDVMRTRADVVAEVGHAGMIKTLIDQLQGRDDRPQLLELMLKQSILLGSVDKYQFLVDSCDKARLDYQDLLFAASRGGDKYILSDLLKLFDNHVAAFDEPQTIIKESFFEACKANNEGAVAILYAKHVEQFTQNQDSITALCFAANVDFKQNPTTLLWLLRQRRNVGRDLTDLSGSTPLHTGCFAGNIECVNALLMEDFDPFHQDNHGNTPLHVHFMGEFINRPIVEKLLWKDEKLKSRSLLKTSEEHQDKEKTMLKMLGIKNSDGDTPLHLLCRKMNSLHMPILHMMLLNKEVTNLQNKEGKMPLHEMIASNGCSEAISALLKNGAQLDMPGRQLQTIVHLACQIGNDSTIKKICEVSKKSKEPLKVLECLNSQGKTPLHCYVSNHGTPDIVKLLCTKNTIVSTDENGLTALDIAVTVSENVEVVKELLRKGARTTNDEKKTSVLHHLCNSAHEDSEEMARLLIQNRADVNAVDPDLKTPLHIAAASCGPKGHSLVKILLTNKADVWKKDRDGFTPIHSCCLSACPESSLSLGVLLGHIQIQNQLLAGLAKKDAYGDTPLHKVSISTGECRNEIARILIKAGADMSLSNSDNDSALDLSQIQENTDLTLLLTEAALVSACKDEEKLDHVERILSRHNPLNTRDVLNRMLRTIVQTDGKYTRSVLDILIIRGGDVKCKTEEGCTLIHLSASAAGEYAEEIIGYLISKGTSITEKDNKGQTALHKVCSGQTVYCKDVITFLHQRGLAVDDRDNMGNTPLHIVFETMRDYYQECMEKLLTLMVEPDICANNTKRISPCDMAKDYGPAVLWKFFEAYCTKVETLRRRPLKILLEYGVDINKQDGDGNTVLHKVCGTTVPHFQENVNLLLSLGADKTIRNKKNETACDVALETGLDYRVIELLALEVLDTDGASISPQSPQTQQSLPCPEWFRRSPSNEGWQHDLRQGMQGIRNAAGMNFFDNQMDEFERQARWKLGNHFKKYM